MINNQKVMRQKRKKNIGLCSEWYHAKLVTNLAEGDDKLPASEIQCHGRVGVLCLSHFLWIQLLCISYQSSASSQEKCSKVFFSQESVIHFI